MATAPPAPAFKLQGEFDAPPALKRQLLQLERAVNDALGRVADIHSARWVMTPLQHDTYNAKLDELVLCDPSAAAFIVNLPAPARHHAGRCITVKNVTSSTNAITIQTAGDIKIDGASSATITAANDVRRCVWSGTAWYLI